MHGPGVVLLALVLAVPAREADKVVRDALAAAVDETKQVNVLLELAWLRDGVDPAVSRRAQEELASFGRSSFPALVRVVNHVRPDQVASVLRTLTEAHQRIPDNPSGYSGALADALWVGDRDAKILALSLLAKFPNESAVQPMIDCVTEDPSLRPAVLEALAATRDDRARFYLDRVFNEGDAATREAAAAVLARIGGRALQPLRNALASTSRDVRLTAIRALLPVATEADVTVLHEYAAAHPDDDPATLQAVRDAAERFERAISQREAAEAASPSPDF